MALEGSYYKVEFQWRLALPICTLLGPALAVLIGLGSKRGYWYLGLISTIRLFRLHQPARRGSRVNEKRGHPGDPGLVAGAFDVLYGAADCLLVASARIPFPSPSAPGIHSSMTGCGR